MAIKVNFTNDDVQERTFGALPNGNYKVRITDLEVAEVANPSSPNVGKPMFKVETTIQEGAYMNQRIWFNVMLFPVGQNNSMWFLASFLKACGYEDALTTGHISDNPEDYLGLEITLKVVKKRDSYRENQLGDDWDGEPIYRNDVNGFVVEDKPATRATKKKSSLAP